MKSVFLASLLALGTFAVAANGSTLDAGFLSPPAEARIRAYWWWLNGNVDRASITRDLEEMKAKGWGGALLCDAGGAEQQGNDRVPAGPAFFSGEWRELYKHALREAHRLGIEISLSIQSGWNLGGPMVPKEDAVKALVWSEAVVRGGSNVSIALPAPPARNDFYRDLFVVAYRNKPGLENRATLRNWRVKALHEKIRIDGPDGWFLANSAPDTSALLESDPAVPGEEDAHSTEVLNLTGRLSANGHLNWNAPAGDWRVLRFGCTLAEINHVSTSSDGWKGYALDVLDETVFKRYWNSIVEPLIADAGPLAGSTLKYLHTDSWETGVHNWTPKLREEFRARRGYDFLPWLPVIAGKIINNRNDSERFLHDFRKTLGDLVIDRHYRPYSQWAARHGLGIHPESGGPHFVPIDAQRALGMNDVPMSEFWATAATHRRSDQTRFFVKQPASAAHVYGRKFVGAEGFTTVGPHWQETIWDNLKPSFDYACTEGLNRLVWHAFVCSPESAGMPGQQYFAGTHFNPNTTWWDKSAPFINYMNRVQFLLQQGLFVADALYYYGDHVPNYTQLRKSDPARLGDGYDYDVITEHAILTRLSVKDGLLMLPDGMSYRLMVLAPRKVMSLPVLEKVRELVRDGATIVMMRPEQASGLAEKSRADERVKAIARELLGDAHSGVVTRQLGKGRVISGRTARDVLIADGVHPDFEARITHSAGDVEYIHRRAGVADIYFVANRASEAQEVVATFRIADRAPELWDAVSGERRMATDYRRLGGRTQVTLQMPPCGSLFVVFRAPAAEHPPTGRSNSDPYLAVKKIDGDWRVAFDPKWKGPGEVGFSQLMNWAEHEHPGVRFYSGTATYRKQFVLSADAAANGTNLYLDLGDVRELAEVKLNGRSCGIVWAPPFRVNVGPAIRAGTNALEIEVVNFWPNRIIGDSALPREDRVTETNIRKFNSQSSLMRSGLFGPVQLLRREVADGVNITSK